MIMIRSPSFSRSASGMLRCLPAGDPAEHGPDGHAKSRQVALPEDVARHDLAGCVEVPGRLPALQEDARVAVHFHSQISEGDPGPQGIGREGRSIDGHRPMALWRIEALGRAGIERSGIEGPRPHRSVEALDGGIEDAGIELQRLGELADGVAHDRREHGGHELADGLRIDDDVPDLTRLLGDEAAPDGIPLGPEILSLVVEADRVLVDDDAEGDGVDPGDDPAVEFRRASVDGDGVALLRIAHLLHARREQRLEDPALVVRRSADDEIIGHLAPALLEPGDVGLESAGCGDECLGGNPIFATLVNDVCRRESAVLHLEPGDFRLVDHLDAEVLRGAVVRVDQGLAPAEEEGVGAPEMECALERRLEPYPAIGHPSAHAGGKPDREPREGLGHEVVAVTYGAEAIEQLTRKDDLQVVISDWVMPVMDGLQLCRHIRGRQHARYVYVLVVTARRGKKRYLEALEAGADDFIPKPIDAEELGARLRVAERILGLQAQMKQLQGLLSICAYCKNIREDDDKWVPIEQYVSQRAHTMFSHGICPNCAAEHFKDWSPKPRPGRKKDRPDK